MYMITRGYHTGKWMVVFVTDHYTRTVAGPHPKHRAEEIARTMNAARS